MTTGGAGGDEARSFHLAAWETLVMVTLRHAIHIAAPLHDVFVALGESAAMQP